MAWDGALALGLSGFGGMILIAALLRRAAAREARNTVGEMQIKTVSWALLAMAAVGIASLAARYGDGTSYHFAMSGMFAGLVTLMLLDGGRLLACAIGRKQSA